MNNNRQLGEIKHIGQKKQFLPIYSETPYAFQIDLTFLESIKNLNNGYNTLFTAININTRFAYAYYGKNKEASTILSFLQNMEKKTIINSITCDEGSEFTNKLFTDYCKKENIEIYFVKSDKYKLGIVNRFHRTLKDKLRTILNDDKKYRWVDYIDEIVDDYNKSVNRGIGVAPIKANSFIENNFIQYAKEKTKILKENYKPLQTDFRIGDYVKIIRRKDTFNDKMLTKYDDIVYKVVRVINNSLYIINNKRIEKIVKKTDCILVEKPDNFELIEKVNLLDKEIKKNRIKKKLKESGVNDSNIKVGTRIKKPNSLYADFY